MRLVQLLLLLFLGPMLDLSSACWLATEQEYLMPATPDVCMLCHAMNKLHRFTGIHEWQLL